MNFKLIRRKIGKFAGAWGFGLDAGLQYEINKWKFGLMARDITSTFNAWNYSLSEEVEKVFIDFNLGKGFTAMTCLDIDIPFDGKRNTLVSSKLLSLDPHLGLEFGYKNIVFVRSGVGNLQKEKNIDGKQIVTCQVNIGVGFTIKKILTIDYALTDLGDISVALYPMFFP
jgi:hypothetical protein